MRSYLVLTLLLFPLISSAMGGVWVLEIDYELNGRRAHGFIRADYWANDFQDLVRKDAAFQKSFHQYYGETGAVMVYERMDDREEIALKATFPMHPFVLDEGSKFGIMIEDMSNISLRKVWVKDDYLIEVLTALVPADTTWIGGDAEITYPLGEDVGCRLEVYNFGESPVDALTLEAMIQAYQEPGPEDQNLIGVSSLGLLLTRLQKQKVVVVELCGC